MNPTEICKKYKVELKEERTDNPFECIVTVKGGTPLSRKLAIAEIKKKAPIHIIVVFKEED
ncbi:hypothetical protein K7T73_12515 [Bacillus badius]|uniref:hypothetical protein n=1 Tax=Bacillus badius TaxID=1455 RepID=UPI001CBE1D9E|nr:hypothetical protein [Bacillus badius]UAT29424.1 hypothetical protein K7T73_12515 [Bacillus badius]